MSEQDLLLNGPPLVNAEDVSAQQALSMDRHEAQFEPDSEVLAALQMDQVEYDAFAEELARELSDFYGTDYRAWQRKSGILEASHEEKFRIMESHLATRMSELASESRCPKLLQRESAE
ncbi:MAG TPA: hypothetical protein VMV10_01495 [Pirellulales bacterium]|nr:hypothetical protein [Pirellulales bacterium]